MAEKERPPSLDHVANIEVPVHVVLAEKAFSLSDITELRPGAILEFSRRHDSPLGLHVNGSRVGQGRALDVGEGLGFLLEELDPSCEG